MNKVGVSMQQWLRDFVNSHIEYMSEEQIAHFKECAIKLNGKDDLIEVFDKFSYNDFVQLGILDYEEIQILDAITDEIAYMKEDEETEDNVNTTEYEKLKEQLSNQGISLVDYELHGDSGLPIISLYLDKDINKWIYQKPIERSNDVSKEEFDTFEDAEKYIETMILR